MIRGLKIILLTSMGVIAACLGNTRIYIVAWFFALADLGQCSNCKINIINGALAPAKRVITLALVEAAQLNRKSG